MSEEIIKIILLGILWITLIISKMIKGKKNKQDFGQKIKDMSEYFLSIADQQKEKYKGSWLCVEEWKEKIRQQTKQITEIYQTEGISPNLSNSFSNVCQDLENGIQVIRDGENPLIIKKSTSTKCKLNKLLSKGLYIFISIALIWLYIVLSALNVGIIFAIIICSALCFWEGLPHNIISYSDYIISQYPWFHTFDGYNKLTINLKQTLCIIILCSLGYFLNGWTYAQSGEVQIAVTVALPIIYAIIYYKLKHKKEVREI